MPDAGQQLIRLRGQWSHVRRARARNPGFPAARPAPFTDTQDGCARRGRRTWEWLIKKVHEADPLLCRRCTGRLRMPKPSRLSSV
jgi:hypothetical protein